MNHGCCKNCWWWKFYTHIGFKNKEFGKCYMQNSENGYFTYSSEDEYCPDYVNRKKEEKKVGTLDEWLKERSL